MAPGSFEVNVESGVGSLSSAGGVLSSEVVGLVVSIVTSTWFDDGPSLEAASVAVAAK